MPLQNVTVFCFGASYAVALILDVLQLLWPRRIQRLVRSCFAGAGLLAHTIFLCVHQPSLSQRYGSLLFLTWILAVFCLYGSLHHRKLAWGVFIWPLVLALIGLAELFAPESATVPPDTWAAHWTLQSIDWDQFWGLAHGLLLLLAAVGVCVGFLASVMYLVQAQRLRAKMMPSRGMRMLSLERLEAMNRHAINLAFPLLTAGVLIGAALLAQEKSLPRGWLDPRVLGALGLWLLFALVLYLRYGAHLHGRRLAVWTIVAFALMLLTLASPTHHLGP
jgi:ABC-type transport system involved in cytochrome c biogenesis permease subunit